MQIIFDFSINKYQTNKYFSTTYLSGLVLHHSLLTQSLRMAIFWNMDFLPGSVAMHLRCGGLFNND